MESSRGLLETSARPFIKLHVKKAETGRYDSKIAGDPYFPIQSEALITPELSAEWVLPSDFQFGRYAGMDAFDYFEQFDDEVYDEYTANAFGHKIGGYASFTQEDPRSYSHQNHTILLLQIDSDDDIDSMWGDVGIANFFIRPEDLKKKDFSNVLYNWDCS